MGIAYRDLIRDWSEVLPTASVCLKVPIAPIDEEENGAKATRKAKTALRGYMHV